MYLHAHHLMIARFPHFIGCFLGPEQIRQYSKIQRLDSEFPLQKLQSVTFSFLVFFDSILYMLEPDFGI